MAFSTGKKLPALRWLLVYWLVALATHASGLFEAMHCDYSCRIRIARDWAGGKELYRETYDNPQPIVFLWVLATDSSWPAASAYLAETALAACACLVFRRALLPSLARVASLVPLLLIVWSGVSPTFYGGQIAEAPALWLDVLGVSCFSLALRSGRHSLALVAGLCFFAMVGFRVPSGLHLATWLALLVALPSPFSERKWSLAATAAGGVGLGLAALFVWGRLDGFGDELLVVIGRNFQYGALDRVPLAVSLVEGGKTLARIQLQNTLVGLLLVVSGVLLFTLRGSLRRGERAWLLVAVVWLAAAVAGAFPGGRHYAHYYHLTWPAVALLSVLWLAPLRRQMQPSARRLVSARLAFGIAAGAVLIGVLGQAHAAVKARRDWQQGTHAWNRLQQASEFLQRETLPQQAVLMNVWLDWAELYWRVPRPAPSLTIPHVVPRDRYEGWLAETRAAMPAWIVTDNTPWEPVDGSLVEESVRRMRDDFAAKIEREYILVRQIDGLRILKRRNER